MTETDGAIVSGHKIEYRITERGSPHFAAVPFAYVSSEKTEVAVKTDFLCIKKDCLAILLEKSTGDIMRREDIQILRDIQKNAELALKAVDTVSDKIYDDTLALQLSRQSLKYSQLRNQAVDKLLSAHLEPARANVMEQMVVAGGIHKDTLLNTSTSHIAEIIIQESSRKISRLCQSLHKYENAGDEAVEIAREFMDFEEANIRQLRKFL